MSDPILDKLDEILDSFHHNAHPDTPGAPLEISPAFEKLMRHELRALLAEVAIEYCAAYYMENGMEIHSPEGIRQRFGVTPSECGNRHDFTVEAPPLTWMTCELKPGHEGQHGGQFGHNAWVWWPSEDGL